MPNDTPDYSGLNTDELIERLQLDDLEEAPLITPVDYAKIRPISAQLVYYRIKSGKLKTYICPCGRRCIKTSEADDLYRKLRGSTAWPYGKERDEHDTETS